MLERFKMKVIIEKGQKFNKLTAIKFKYQDKDYAKFWLFKCDCGVEKIINVSKVKTSHTKSCGCLRIERNKEKIKHGMCRTKIYGIWIAMKERCLNKNNKNYKDYGDRGIKICSEWLNKKSGFINFYKDMGECPEGKSLDRINNNGNYCKNNCRYATKIEQMNNMRTNHLIIYKNRTQTIAQWSRELGIKQGVILHRITMGLTINGKD